MVMHNRLLYFTVWTNPSCPSWDAKMRHWYCFSCGGSIGWMDDLWFYILFNSILVISGWRVGDNERLCAVELRLRLKRSSLQAELFPRTARSAGQRITHWATGAPGSIENSDINFFQDICFSSVHWQYADKRDTSFHRVCVKVYGYISIFFHQFKRRQFSWVPVCLLGGGSCPKRCLHIKERICSDGSKFFPLWDDPNLNGRHQWKWQSCFPWKCTYSP